MKSRIGNWLSRIAQRSNIALLNKIGKSLERDRDQALSTLARKAVVFMKSMTVAPFNLRKCDAVGKRPRTRCRPNIENAGRIIIGNDVNINSRNVRTDLVTGPSGLLEIGNEVSINFGVSIVAYKKVSIGNRIRIGPYTMIYDSNMHVQGNRFSWAEGEPVVIEDDVWLASRVLVLKGSMVGRGSVIAAGSVVSGVIPPYVVAGGVPARVLKFLPTPEYLTDFSWEINDEKQGYTADIYNRVEKIFFDVLPHLKFNQLDVSLSPGMVDGWDSMAHVRFIRKLEQEFGITFRANDWSRLSNINKICRIIQKYLNQSEISSLKEIRSL